MKNIIYIIVIIILSQLLISCGEKSDPSNIDGFTGIIIVNSDGTDPIRIDNTRNCIYPQLVPNSDKILFIKDDNLYSINEDGSEKKRLTYELEIYNGEPASFSQDGQQIYFSAISNEMQNYAIYKYSFVDNNVELVRNHPDFNCYNIDISADDNKLMISEYGEDNSIIVEIDLQTMEVDTLLYNQFGYVSYRNAVYGLENKIYYSGYDGLITTLNSYDRESNTNTVLVNNIAPPLKISPNKEVLALNVSLTLHYFIDETDLVKVSQVTDFDIANDAIVYTDGYWVFKLDFSSNEAVELDIDALRPSFSLDGQRIVYYKRSSATRDTRDHITK